MGEYGARLLITIPQLLLTIAFFLRWWTARAEAKQQKQQAPEVEQEAPVTVGVVPGAKGVWRRDTGTGMIVSKSLAEVRAERVS